LSAGARIGGAKKKLKLEAGRLDETRCRTVGKQRRPANRGFAS
jgi:hypothetical protein